MRACFDHYGKKNWGERGGGENGPPAPPHATALRAI